MDLFTGVQHLCAYSIVAPLFVSFVKCLEGVMHHQHVHLCWCSYWPPYSTDKFICCSGCLAVVLLLWRRDRNRMDSYRLRTVDVSESPIASAARRPWQQQCDSLYCYEEWWGSVPPSVMVFSWVYAITISSPKWKNHCEGPGTTQEMNYPCCKVINREHQQR